MYSHWSSPFYQNPWLYTMIYVVYVWCDSMVVVWLDLRPKDTFTNIIMVCKCAKAQKFWHSKYTSIKIPIYPRIQQCFEVEPLKEKNEIVSNKNM